MQLDRHNNCIQKEVLVGLSSQSMCEFSQHATVYKSSVTEIQHVCERMLPFPKFVIFSGAGQEPADAPAYEEQQSMGLDYGTLAIDF